MFVASADGLPSAGLAGAGGQPWDSPPGGNRLPLPLPERLPYELTPLLPLRSYHWQGADNRACAERWWRAAVGILADTGSSSLRWSSGANDSVSFLIQQTVDVYHRDRAQFAARYLPAKPAPQRLSDIPERIAVVEGPGERTRWYHRRLSSLRFAREVPAFATDKVASLPAAALPDSWWVVTYARKVSVHDPLIFAQFGEWFVKVAEWA